PRTLPCAADCLRRGRRDGTLCSRVRTSACRWRTGRKRVPQGNHRNPGPQGLLAQPRDRDSPMTPQDIAVLDWSKGDGLLPAVVQDAHTGQVLMLGFMNEAALRKTIELGR